MSVRFLNRCSEGHFKSNGAQSLILLFSLTFEDGAIVTRDAYIVFMKLASREELQTHQVADVPTEMLNLFDKPIMDVSEMQGLLTNISS